MWRSQAAHLLWEQGVGGSNPPIPTQRRPTGSESDRPPVAGTGGRPGVDTGNRRFGGDATEDPLMRRPVLRGPTAGNLRSGIRRTGPVVRRGTYPAFRGLSRGPFREPDPSVP